jgi:hypothetical protein
VNAPLDLVKRIKEAFELGNYTLRVHGFERMIERGIHPKSIRNIVLQGDAIEYDPAGVRGLDDSVLFNGQDDQQTPLHVKVAERVNTKGYRYFVVTVYKPNPQWWEDNYTKRR